MKVSYLLAKLQLRVLVHHSRRPFRMRLPAPVAHAALLEGGAPAQGEAVIAAEALALGRHRQFARPGAAAPVASGGNGRHGGGLGS